MPHFLAQMTRAIYPQLPEISSLLRGVPVHPALSRLDLFDHHLAGSKINREWLIIVLQQVATSG